MMYMHYCKRCHRIFMLNGHKQSCPSCHEPITELKIPYMEYVSMNLQERAEFREKCADEAELKKLSTTYRMYKYSKWYKELQKQKEQAAIVSYSAQDDPKPVADAVMMG